MLVEHEIQITKNDQKTSKHHLSKQNLMDVVIFEINKQLNKLQKNLPCLLFNLQAVAL